MKKEAQEYLFKIFSTILNKMSSEAELNSACQIIKLCIQYKKLTQLKSDVKSQIALIICGKILTSSYEGIGLGEHVIKLLVFLHREDLVNVIFSDFVDQQIQSSNVQNKKQKENSNDGDFQNRQNLGNKSRKLTGDFGVPKTREKEQFCPPEEIKLGRKVSKIEIVLIKNLFFLFELVPEAGNYFKKNYGHSLLDLEGNILWADNRTCTIFDLKKSDFKEQDSKMNLFDKMIPFSKNLLQFKFSDQLFGPEARLGSSVSFAYVIYSRVAMEKCRNALVHFQNSSKQKHDYKNLDNYEKFLKSVTSRATLMELSYSASELKSLIDSEKCRFEMCDSKLDQLRSECLDFSREKGLRQRRIFVFLESRLSSVKPDFDYQSMDNDQEIKNFEKHIQDHLAKNIKKQNKRKPKGKRGRKKRPNLDQISTQPNQNNNSEKSNLNSLPHNKIENSPFPNMSLDNQMVHSGFRPTQEKLDQPPHKRGSLYQMRQSRAEPFLGHPVAGNGRIKARNPSFVSNNQGTNRGYFAQGIGGLGKRDGLNIFPKPSSHSLKKGNQF